ncbi:GLUG motif-containing protein, partial [Bacillus cereus group sp. BC10]
NVIALENSSAGGLVGYNVGRILTSSAKGNVSTRYSSRAGGLVGRNFGTIADSRATGLVKAGDFSSVGGLVGSNERGSIVRSTASGDVEG